MRSAVSLIRRAISLFSTDPLQRSAAPHGRNSSRLYVNQHVRYPVQLFPDASFDLSGDFVRFAHRHVRINFEMKIDMVSEACRARIALLDTQSAGYGQRNGSDFGHFRWLR